MLGVQSAWLVSGDVDPPVTLLTTTPRTYRRAVSERFVMWLALSSGALFLAAQSWPGGTAWPVLRASFGVLVLAAGVSLEAGSRLGSHLGGAVAVGLLLVAGVLLASIRGGRMATSASAAPAAHAAWELGIGLVLICSALVRLQRRSIRGN